MIEIISEEGDKTTNIIIEWILYYKKDVRRINVENFTDISIFLTNTKEVSELNNVFHRRAKLNVIPYNLEFKKYYFFFKEEEDVFIKALEKIYKEESKYIGGYYEEQQHNKIYDLHIAKKIGLNIPNTLVTNKKDDLLAFYSLNNKKIITKPIKNSIDIQHEDYWEFGKSTFVIKSKDLELLDSYFNLGFFQELIEKKFEIRVFIYGKEIYSMAIFSQNNEKTRIDYRNYDDDKPNRCVPYSLPKVLVSKLFKFMKYKGIDTGSIDIIFSKTNEYYFLENNPQGQIDWLSRNCNYYIEKKIAELLIS